MQAEVDGWSGAEKFFKLMNKAMVAKHGWTILVQENKPRVQALKSKYFPHFDFLKCNKKKGCSWIGAGILKSKEILQKGAYYRVGSGDNISVWHGPMDSFHAGF